MVQPSANEVFKQFYIPIQGTWGWDDEKCKDWWEVGSPFTEFLSARGLHVYNAPRQFEWSTQLTIGGSKLNWKAAGKALCYYTETIPFESRNFIAHSHGLQPILYAAYYGLKVRNLITVGSPRRKDVIKYTGRANILNWCHVYDPVWDRIALLGQLLDGSISIRRLQPDADINLSIRGISHSKLVNDPEYFKEWVAHGLLEFLRYSSRPTTFSQESKV